MANRQTEARNLTMCIWPQIIPFDRQNICDNYMTIIQVN